MEHSWWSAGEGVNSMFIYRKKGSPQGTIILTDDTLLGSVPPSPLTPHWRAFLEPRSSYLRLRCAGALQGPKNLRWLMGAEGGHLFTASSHGRICNVGKAKCQDGLSQYTVSSLLLSALWILWSPPQPLVLPLPSCAVEQSAGPTIRLPLAAHRLL